MYFSIVSGIRGVGHLHWSFLNSFWNSGCLKVLRIASCKTAKRSFPLSFPHEFLHPFDDLQWLRHHLFC
jgi:hypothetical protein